MNRSCWGEASAATNRRGLIEPRLGVTPDRFPQAGSSLVEGAAYRQPVTFAPDELGVGHSLGVRPQEVERGG